MCLAPPGWELVDGAENITECQIGWYKADWNRNLVSATQLQLQVADARHGCGS